MTMTEGQHGRQRSADIDKIIFDLGGVLVDWNPRHPAALRRGLLAA